MDLHPTGIQQLVLELHRNMSDIQIQATGTTQVIQSSDGHGMWWPHRWLAMLESGKVENLTKIAALEGIDNSYVSRMVNLKLFDIAVDPPALWEEQRLILVSSVDNGDQ